MSSNPAGKLPALVDGDLTLTESVAIVQYPVFAIERTSLGVTPQRAFEALTTIEAKNGWFNSPITSRPCADGAPGG